MPFQAFLYKKYNQKNSNDLQKLSSPHFKIIYPFPFTYASPSYYPDKLFNFECIENKL